jgi:large subunit ribosomal protein L34
MLQLRQQFITQQFNMPTSFTPISAPLISTVLLGLGRRWKSRGNNYQPNTYKRKRTLGFMSRMRSKTGRKIVERRRAKGRWYLAH